jgi:tetratricopeptide (TPR) repeat protein
MAEKTSASTALPPMDEINAKYKTRSIIRREMKIVSDSSTTVNSTVEKEDILQLASSRIIGNFVLIWFDPNIDTNDEDIEYSIEQLRRIVADLKTFTDINECMDFLTDIVNEKVFMIISGHLGHHILSFIQDISQLQSIYIFCEQQTKHEEWIKEYKKVKGVFNQVDPICNALKDDVRQSEIDMVPISIISIPSTINLDELDPSFMYSQLLKETILDIEFDEEAKTKFANYCYANYPGNSAQLNKISMFQHEYEQHSAIWWYTKEPFVYSTLNKALRTQDTATIILMGFFLKDLHRDIKNLHQEMQETSKIIVYRGQGMLNADFNKMKNSKGALLSFNNFLSTSLDQEVSKPYAISSRDNPELTGILFKMEIDPSISTSPFALLDNTSCYSDKEKEILLSMHTIFRINEIQQIDERLYQVSLTLTHNIDQQLKHLTDYINNELGDQDGWCRLGSLMLRMGELEKAEQIFKTIIETTSAIDSTKLALIYNSLGLTQEMMGKYPTALSYYQKTLEIQQNSLSHNHPDLGRTYNNIGMVYQLMGEYSTALSYYQKTLDIQQKSLSHNHPNLATTYSNIGTIYQLMRESSAALSYFEETLKIQQKSLPSNHPDISRTYNNIGIIYQSIGKYSNALLYYQKTLDIQQKSLPNNHPNLATTYSNIGTIYQSMGERSAALSYFEETLKIQQKSLPSNHPDISRTYNNIGTIYQSMGESSAAFSYFEETLKIQQKSLPSNHPDISRTYNNIGMVYQLMGEYSTALLYYQKTLDIQQKSLSHNHPNLATTYNNIGMTYQSMGVYSIALSYYRKTLAIKQKSLRRNHPDLASTYNNIGMIYQSMEKYSTALSYLEKTLEIQQESHPRNDPDLAITYNNIGMVHRSMGKYSIALSYYQKTLDIQQKSLPHNHPNLATTYSNIGMVYQSMGENWLTALFFYENALKIIQNSIPINYAGLASIHNNIGCVHHKMRDHWAALSDFEKALKIVDESRVPNNPIIVELYGNYAASLDALGRREEAINYAERSVETARRVLGLNHSKTKAAQNFSDELQR